MMMQRGPLRSQQSYRHEALLWHTAEDFTDALVPFVDEGLDAGEPVMVAVTPQHTAWLQEALGDAAAQEVQFVDMMSLGQNPARIIPAWREFVDAESAGRGPVRGIGEPIWPGRHAEELLECQLHEALLNVAIEPATPLWLICPYDAASLDARGAGGGFTEPSGAGGVRIASRQRPLRRPPARRRALRCRSPRAARTSPSRHLHRGHHPPAGRVREAGAVDHRAVGAAGGPARRGHRAAGPRQPAPWLDRRLDPDLE